MPVRASCALTIVSPTTDTLQYLLGVGQHVQIQLTTFLGDGVSLSHCSPHIHTYATTDGGASVRLFASRQDIWTLSAQVLGLARPPECHHESANHPTNLPIP